jgi:hypothetical protein
MMESTTQRESQDLVRQDEARFREQLAFFESVLIEWLEAERVTVACGSWADGGIAEFLPRGKATLLPAVYEGCFEGVRELRLEGLEHHMHLDPGRVHRLTYSIAPSVCFAGKPSFELRLLTTGPGGARTSRGLLGERCMVRPRPNPCRRTNLGKVRGVFFDRGTRSPPASAPQSRRASLSGAG